MTTEQIMHVPGIGGCFQGNFVSFPSVMHYHLFLQKFQSVHIQAEASPRPQRQRAKGRRYLWRACRSAANPVEWVLSMPIE
jgi:hypothetical protein